MTTEQVSPLLNLIALAERYDRAGDAAKAAGLYRLAAQHAAAAYEHDEALRLLDRALALSHDAAPAARFELILRRERLNGLLGQAAAQKRDLASLEMVAASLQDDGKRAVVAVRQAAWRETSGDYAAAVSLGGLAARLAQLAVAPAAEAEAQLVVGRALQNQGHFDLASVRLARAASLAETAGEAALAADALRAQGALDNDREQFGAALESYDRAARLYEQLGDRLGLAQVRCNLAHVHAHQGQLAAALSQWEESQALYRDLGDFEGSVRVLINLGAIHVDLGQFATARQYLEQASELAGQIRLLPGQCFAALNLGLVAHRSGKHEEAIAHLRRAQALAEEMGARRLEGAVLVVLGHALAGAGQVAQAGDIYWESLAIWEELGLSNLATEARAGLARIALQSGTPSLALFFVEEIVTQLRHDPRLEGVESPVEVYLTVYQVLDRVGDARAAELLAQGRELLMSRVAGLADESARAAVLQNVAAHRELLSAAAVLS